MLSHKDLEIMSQEVGQLYTVGETIDALDTI